MDEDVSTMEGARKGMTVVLAAVIFLLIVVFIFMFIIEFFIRVIFVIVAFGALLRVLYQVMRPGDEEEHAELTEKEKRTIERDSKVVIPEEEDVKGDGRDLSGLGEVSKSMDDREDGA